MFWQFGFNTPSPIEAVLEKEDCTLAEVLAEDDLIQECKAINPKLIDFLKAPAVVEVLLGYLVIKAEDGAPDEIKYKLPYLAYEIFFCEVTELIDAVFATEGLMQKFMGFLSTDGPLDSLLVGYFSKVLVVFMRKKPDATAELFKANQEYFPKLVSHCGRSLCIAELLTNIIGAGVHSDAALLPPDFIVEAGFIPQLVRMIGSDECGPFAQEHASQVLISLLEHYSNLAPWRWDSSAPCTPLVAQLKSEECCTLLVDYCCCTEDKTCRYAVGVMTALLELLREERDSEGMTEEDEERDNGTPEVVQSLAGKGGELLAALLLRPPSVTGGQIILTHGVIPESLGSTRMAMMQCLLALLGTGAAEVAAMFSSARLFEPMLDLAFRLKFNNILHNLVVQMAMTAIHEVSDNTELVESMLLDCGMVAKLVEAFDGYDVQDDQRFQSAGNIGHFRQLAMSLATTTAPSVVRALAKLDGTASGFVLPARSALLHSAAAEDLRHTVSALASTNQLTGASAASNRAGENISSVQSTDAEGAEGESAATEGAAELSGLAASWWALSDEGGILEAMVKVDESEGLAKIKPGDDGSFGDSDGEESFFGSGGGGWTPSTATGGGGGGGGAEQSADQSVVATSNDDELASTFDDDDDDGFGELSNASTSPAKSGDDDANLLSPPSKSDFAEMDDAFAKLAASPDAQAFGRTPADSGFSVDEDDDGWANFDDGEEETTVADTGALSPTAQTDGTQTVPPSPGAQAAAEVLEAMARLDATSSAPEPEAEAEAEAENRELD